MAKGLTKIGGAQVGSVTTDLMTIGVVAALGYFAYTRLLGPSKKDQVTSQNNSTVDQATKDANAATQQQAQATGQQPSLSPAAINALANTVLQIINSYAPDDFPITDVTTPTLSMTVNQCNNYADWVALVNQFGTKNLLDGTSVDLTTALSRAMTPSAKSGLNSYFANQGIVDPITRTFVAIP